MGKNLDELAEMKKKNDDVISLKEDDEIIDVVGESEADDAQEDSDGGSD